MNISESKKAAHHLAKSGIGSILDYSVEGKENEIWGAKVRVCWNSFVQASVAEDREWEDQRDEGKLVIPLEIVNKHYVHHREANKNDDYILNRFML